MYISETSTISRTDCQNQNLSDEPRNFARILCQIRITLVNIKAAEILRGKKREDCSQSNSTEVPQKVDILGGNKGADSVRTSDEKGGTKRCDRKNTLGEEKFMQPARKMKRVRGRPRKTAGEAGTTEVLHCEWCDKVFNQKSILKRHISTKHAQRLLKCEACDATFAMEEDLGKHVKVKHKPIQCSECPKTFKTITGFKLHRSGHHKDAVPRAKGETRISDVVSACSICHGSFHSKRKLSEHH